MHYCSQAKRQRIVLYSRGLFIQPSPSPSLRSLCSNWLSNSKISSQRELALCLMLYDGLKLINVSIINRWTIYWEQILWKIFQIRVSGPLIRNLWLFIGQLCFISWLTYLIMQVNELVFLYTIIKWMINCLALFVLQERMMENKFLWGLWWWWLTATKVCCNCI